MTATPYFVLFLSLVDITFYLGELRVVLYKKAFISGSILTNSRLYSNTQSYFWIRDLVISGKHDTWRWLSQSSPKPNRFTVSLQQISEFPKAYLYGLIIIYIYIYMVWRIICVDYVDFPYLMVCYTYVEIQTNQFWHFHAFEFEWSVK